MEERRWKDERKGEGLRLARRSCTNFVLALALAGARRCTCSFCLIVTCVATMKPPSSASGRLQLWSLRLGDCDVF